MHSPPLDSSERSSPAQKAFSPVPVTTMTRTRLSFSALFMMSSMAAEVTALIALRFSGRLMRMMSTPSSRRSVTTSWVPWKSAIAPPFIWIALSRFGDLRAPRVLYLLWFQMLCERPARLDIDAMGRGMRKHRHNFGKALIARNRGIPRYLREGFAGCRSRRKRANRRKRFCAV